MLEWYVYVSNFNAKRIETYNVFNHAGFTDDLRKNAKKNSENREAFEEQLRRSLMYWYWSKCEWEIMLSEWPHREDSKDMKVDVFSQIWLNKQRFCDYVWENRKELMANRKRKEKK